MHKIEKSRLFTKLTVEQSATVSGGSQPTDAVLELARQLADYGAKMNATVNVVSNGNPVSNSSGSTPTPSPAPSGLLRGFKLVSGGLIDVKEL
ncbi:hypothetical protein [Iningainema tapete]|uniref:Uncharacterized protein n=1 Tax=Iningainema tapete BLCC-T55 TaxID=2748662 RepID=A0A8J6XQE2_9CYAN|nr:hypothetical protein [Iningainema tapete]MBD2771508.1 hypothetical protein [Iningainema tapete BLCC-T55]